MSNSIEFDISAFVDGLTRSASNVRKSAKIGVGDATEHLLAASTDLAPMKKGTLRGSSGMQVDESGGVIEGEVTFSATETDKNGERANYALITHELHSGDGFSGVRFKDPTTPGTQPKYLERPLKENAEKYRDMIADAIREGLT